MHVHSLKLYGFLCFLLTAAVSAGSPVFYLPLDGTTEIFGESGKRLGQGIVHGRSSYRAGVIGKSLDIRRQAYDQATSVVVEKLPPMNCSNGTVAFWFKPHWKEMDPEGHWIFQGRDAHWQDFRFYFFKAKTGYIELSVCSPQQVQILKRNVFKQDQWAHVAFTWDWKKSAVCFYINGKQVGKRVKPGAMKQYAKDKVVNFYFGKEDTDRFKANVGDGLYDDVKVFDRCLGSEEIALLASGKQETVSKELSMKPVVQSAGSLSFGLRYKDAVPSVPCKLLTLHGAKPGHSLVLTALGTSGKLSLRAVSGKDIVTMESSYTLRLDQPHKVAVRQSGNELVFCLDDAVQGRVVLKSPFGEVSRITGAEGVSLLSPSVVPGASDLQRLSDRSMSDLERSLWSWEDASRREEGVRRGICLNGIWRAFPVSDYSYAPPAGAWGYMRVPGSFRSPLFEIYRQEKGKLSPLSWTWQQKPLISYRCGWYQRLFEVPKDLRGQGRLYVNFTNLNGDAGRVYLNGKLICEFRQDFKCFTTVPNARRLDVTDQLSLTGPNVLTVFLDRHYVGLWRGQPSIGDHGELALGDVWLERAPSALSIKTAVALSSYRQKAIFGRCRLQNLSGSKGVATLRFAFWREGKIAKQLEQSVELDGSAEQLVCFKAGWRNPVLWNVDHPELYRLEVSLERDGQLIDTFPAQDFGFREAWVENGEFRLNGNKLRLRMYSSPGLNRVRYYYGNPKAVGQYVAHIKKNHYDTMRFDPIGKTSQVGWPGYLRECGRQGLYNLFPMPPYEDEDLEEYRRGVERFLECYGGQPSILMWYTDFNTCGYAWDQDPAKLNDTSYVPLSKVHARKMVQTAERVMRGMDPTRELFQHAGGNSGKIFTSMNYQSLGTPLQEQEDWPRQWSEKHEQPLMVVESAFPYPLQLWHFEGKRLGLPKLSLFAEHAARYFGDQVFAWEDRPVPHASWWLNSPYARWNRNFLALSGMLYHYVVRAWRTYDMSGLGDFPGQRDLGLVARTYNQHDVVYEVDNDVKTPGLKPDIKRGWSETQRHLLTDYTQPEGLTEEVRGAMAPLLVYIGGDPQDFTNKDHAFFAGETFRKSVVVVNDHADEKALVCQWELRTADGVIDSGTEKVKAAPGEILKVPLKLEAPPVYKRTEAALFLTVLENDRLLAEDVLPVQFFPKHARREFRDVAAGLYDPEGRTRTMLKKAGFPFREVKTLPDVQSCRLLIIGQNALKGSHPELLRQVEESGLIAGGLKVLLFEQQDCNLGNLVFESPSYRNAFIRRPESPLLAGLEEADFSNWRGSSDSVPAYVLSAENSPHYPRSKWKCGNGGIVAGNVIRKPSYGAFKPIVDCGFNLMFAALMELRLNHGLVLFCQLDVTCRYGTDPVATQLVDNMLSEMGSRFVPIGPQRVCYLGDDAGEKILQRMGVNYRRLQPSSLHSIQHYQVLILGANPVPGKLRDSLKKVLGADCTVVALPGAPLELLPGGLVRGKTQLFRASVPQDDPVFAGIPQADLYFREAMELPVLTSMPDWCVATKPALFAKLDSMTTAIVVLNLAPENITGPWNSEKVARVWSQLFANMNIGLGKDLKLFTGTRARHNTKRYHFGQIEVKKGRLQLDPKNDGKVTDKVTGTEIRLGICWESQGILDKNPHHVYPPKTSRTLKNPYDGYAWIRCSVTIPKDWKGHKIRLVGGPFDDSDWTYWNGRKIGEMTLESNEEAWKTPRDYTIPQELVRFGQKNDLVIHIYDRWGGGGVVGPLQVIAEESTSEDSWSPYIDQLDFYDVDAYHNW